MSIRKSRTPKSGNFSFYFAPNGSEHEVNGFRAIVVGDNHTVVHKFNIDNIPRSCEPSTYLLSLQVARFKSHHV